MSFYLLDRHAKRDVPRSSKTGTGRPWYTSRNVCQHGIRGPHLIVLHSAENLPDWDGEDAGAEAVARYGAGTERASWHWTVDSDSTIAMLPHSHTAFHVRNFNSCSVGIEIATQAGKWVGAPEEWLQAVYDRVADLLADVADDTGIPLLDRRTEPHKWGVTTHAVLDPTRRTDPGAAFPFKWVLQMASGGFRYGQPSAPPSPPTTPAPTPTPPDRPLAPVPLLAVPSVTIRDMQDWARSHNATTLFISLASTAYVESAQLGVDPAISYAIMGHETGYGRFGGVLDETYRNWGGIKRASGGGDYDAGAHHRFRSHIEGVRAVAQHVAGYAGIRINLEQVVDPRLHLLAGKRLDEIPDDNDPTDAGDDWSWSSGSDHDVKIARNVHEMRAI